jgi:hypothetical protein
MSRRQPLEPPRFVDDALEQARDRRVIERPGVHGTHVPQHLSLARRLIDGLADLLLEPSDVERAGRPLVQELDQLLVNCVDPASQRLDVVHRSVSLQPSHKPLCPGRDISASLGDISDHLHERTPDDRGIGEAGDFVDVLGA